MAEHGGGGEKVVVAVRSRPVNERESEVMRSKGQSLVVGIHNSTISLAGKALNKEDRNFTFDHAFWSSNEKDKHYVSQEEVYKAIGVDLLDNAFKGYNACIFAYGQTGSGKTYTMMGNPSSPGLIPRICGEMFKRMAKNSDKNRTYKVECSYMEIYNEKVRDLLAMSDKKVSLRVREHKILGPYVEGLRTFAVSGFDDIAALLNEGIKSRVTAATSMNDESSRSHAVFTIHLTEAVYDGMSDNTGEKTSKISLVDLAGSERVSRSGAEGERLREGGSINKSLSTLGLVISHLAEIASGKRPADSFVPYRDSVLTWLLKENLGGNSKTVMVATVSPSPDNFEETLSTLRYADTAKKIMTHAIVNEDANARLIRELKDEVNRLKSMLSGAGLEGGLSGVSEAQLAQLREQLLENQRLMSEKTMSWEEKVRIAHQLLEERAQQLKNMGISVQGGGISVAADKFYLLNLQPNLSGNELTMYHLGRSTQIGSAPGQDIVIRGEAIQPKHCVLTVRDGDLHIMPIDQAVVQINGEPVTGSTKVVHGSALRLGAEKEFRFICPGKNSSDSVKDDEPEEEDYNSLTSTQSWPGSRFHRACEQGDVGQVQLMLASKKESPNSDQARWKRPPIMLAADGGYRQVVQLLLAEGADPGRPDERGYTALHASADSGHLEVCQILVRAGANPDPEAIIGCSPLHRAADMGHLEVCKFLLSQGANVNKQDRGKGWTPLLLAALHGRTQVCELLLAHGANPNLATRFGETALHLAAEPGHVDVLRILLKAGADATLEQAYGRTAFDYAAETTSFMLLHSPPERITRREEACRLLFPLMKSSQRSTRSLSERKTITIAQAANLRSSSSGPASSSFPSASTARATGNASSSGSSGYGGSASSPRRSNSFSSSSPRPARAAAGRTLTLGGGGSSSSGGGGGGAPTALLASPAKSAGGRQTPTSAMGTSGANSAAAGASSPHARRRLASASSSLPSNHSSSSSSSISSSSSVAATVSSSSSAANSFATTTALTDTAAAQNVQLHNPPSSVPSSSATTTTPSSSSLATSARAHTSTSSSAVGSVSAAAPNNAAAASANLAAPSPVRRRPVSAGNPAATEEDATTLSNASLQSKVVTPGTTRRPLPMTPVS